MNEKEKQIITKLLSAVSKQQQVIHKLAQAVEKRDPNIDYLNNGLIALVAANSGIPNVRSEVTVVPKGPAGSVGNATVEQPATYYAAIHNVPANKHQSFAKALITQLEQQKPELRDRFSYSFEG